LSKAEKLQAVKASFSMGNYMHGLIAKATASQGTISFPGWPPETTG